MKHLDIKKAGLTLILALMAMGCVVSPARTAHREEARYERVRAQCERAAYREADDVRGRRHAQQVVAQVYSDCMYRRGYDVR